MTGRAQVAFVPLGALRVFGWLVLAAAILSVDYLLGPVIQFHTLFVIPVSLAAWWSGRWPALGLAVVLPLVRLYFTTVLDPPWTLLESVANAGIRLVMLCAFAILVDRVRQSLALAREVDILRGLLPICAFCKKIRDQKEAWQPLEKYISERSSAEFSHAVCPECYKEHYAETFDRR